MTDKAYPELPRPGGEIEQGGGWIQPTAFYTADQMRAYYDLGRNAAGSGISDAQIAALRDKHGITSSGRGIRAFDQIRNFVHAVLAMAPATTQPHPSSAPDPSTQQRALAHRCRTRGPGSRNPAEGEEL